ncbi:asparagine synthase B [Pleionea sp. CnH1-48]|uniref:asparagine synthase B n=1 Tax=Pleionea sp. CnH1-48 TaxID=2954494 RepID=UPI0020979CD6|nr:asparagine synthase B [Pleionea sp. CnH1-48]MCO7224570.1 asparagine synthase B [Pleionea sp. CnH1-48]
MCSILGILDIKSDGTGLRKQAIQMSKKQRHRGPDWSGVYESSQAILVHERLAIVDVTNGAQPLYSADKSTVLAVNGEIYNHRELREQLAHDYDFQTQSDCEVILALYQEKGLELLQHLNGMFAFILYDERKESYLIARDPIGIIPLYTGYDQHGNFFVSSEMKAVSEVCETVQTFPPGHYLSSETGEITPYYQPAWQDYQQVSHMSARAQDVRESLTASVKRHLMTDVPYGVLLSGGLDSSIVAAVAKQFVERRIEDDEASQAWWPALHTFAVGLEGSPDLAAAQKVADHIGSVHHSFTYTIQDGIDALQDVIYHLETYDVTTIRASTPMYLMARQIRAMGIKMVLSGEGADEIFGGYLYFHKAPDAQAFHEETVRKLDKLHWYDCLRANKSMSAWGVEARVPFLDREFIDVAMNLNPEAKMITEGKMEKHILREAFVDLLPEEILWRQKEQFSDGVGYSWIDTLKAYAEEQVSDEQLKNAQYRFPLNTPETKEAYFYREIFHHHFPSQSAAATVPGGKSVACSTPEALAWDQSLNQCIDPSGRAVASVHEDSY